MVFHRKPIRHASSFGRLLVELGLQVILDCLHSFGQLSFSVFFVPKVLSHVCVLCCAAMHGCPLAFGLASGFRSAMHGCVVPCGCGSQHFVSCWLHVLPKALCGSYADRSMVGAADAGAWADQILIRLASIWARPCRHILCMRSNSQGPTLTCPCSVQPAFPPASMSLSSDAPPGERHGSQPLHPFWLPSELVLRLFVVPARQDQHELHPTGCLCE
jgi:hypothetical protein